MIPEAIIGACMGSVITLVGVIVNNKSALARQKEQLAHDAEQKKIDRDLSLKRTIYFNVIEEYSKIKCLINNISNINLHDFKEFQMHMMQGSEIEKIKAIGSEETIKNVAKLNDYLSTTLIRLLQQLLPIQNLRDQLRFETNQNEKFLEKLDIFNNLMTEHNIERKDDNDRFRALQHNFEFFVSVRLYTLDTINWKAWGESKEQEPLV
jgi:hypothetical protein